VRINQDKGGFCFLLLLWMTAGGRPGAQLSGEPLYPATSPLGGCTHPPLGWVPGISTLALHPKDPAQGLQHRGCCLRISNNFLPLPSPRPAQPVSPPAQRRRHLNRLLLSPWEARREQAWVFLAMGEAQAPSTPVPGCGLPASEHWARCLLPERERGETD
jgi:hypothetical protein